MGLLEHLVSLRNSLDFTIRSRVRIGRPLDTQRKMYESEVRLQRELEEFLAAFSGLRDFELRPKHLVLNVLDVGCRNFILGPVIDRFFQKKGMLVSIDGIEIDAFRRFTDLRTRADYGEYFAQQCRSARFHAQDFLQWKQPADIIFLLNPFVEKEQLLAWGLPLSTFKPEKIFSHCRELLRADACLVVSCPSESEFAAANYLAEKVGLRLVEVQSWSPDKSAAQKQPRFGALFR
mgnify:CR=1 FL=1